MIFFFFKQKTAYEIYQCDWSSDVCSSDLGPQKEEPLQEETSPELKTSRISGQVIAGDEGRFLEYFFR